MGSRSAEQQNNINMKTISCLVLLVVHSQGWWSRRIPQRSRGGGGYYRRYGRSDSDMAEENIDYDYDDNEFIEALADVLIDKQEKRNVASLVRNRDLRNIGSFYGKRAVMNPMAINKGLTK